MNHDNWNFTTDEFSHLPGQCPFCAPSTRTELALSSRQGGERESSHRMEERTVPMQQLLARPAEPLSWLQWGRPVAGLRGWSGRIRSRAPHRGRPELGPRRPRAARRTGASKSRGSGGRGGRALSVEGTELGQRRRAERQRLEEDQGASSNFRSPQQLLTRIRRAPPLVAC